MKPEKDHKKRISVPRRLLYFPALIYIFTISPAQQAQKTDSITLIRNVAPAVSPINIRLLSYPVSGNHDVPKLKPPGGQEDIKTMVFLDSLRSRASKTLITKKLYEFVITSPGPEPSKEIRGPSEAGFMSYKGFRINKIEIKRLNVFGTYLSTPEVYEPSRIESILNKTHFNTNENIIRKNLLFHEGDSISPLTLSDNERFLRDLPYIDDARILVMPVSDYEADIIVITKDVYSLGANMSFSGFDKFSLSVFDKNIFGMGHEFGIELPYNSRISDVPGFGVRYMVNNIRKSFTNFDVYYRNGLGKTTYGFDLIRNLMSSKTKYAGGISLSEVFTTDDLDTMPTPQPIKYTLQDYWFLRSFLINEQSVSRLVLGARYTNNNVYLHPEIPPDSYYNLQRYKLFLGSLTFSFQKYHKANLIYGYGRTEDIPYGGLINVTAGREINEYKKRYYLGTSISLGESISRLGYFYASFGFATFLNDGKTEQGMALIRTNYFSKLYFIGRYRLRNFINLDYTRGFNRYSDEYLNFIYRNGFSGFRNDSTRNTRRMNISLESVLFSPASFYGFKFALFGFADYGILFKSNEFVGNGFVLSSIGLGVRIRNNNLVFNTLQIRLCFYPKLPDYSRTNNLIISGEQLLKPDNFEPVRPSLLLFK